MQQLKYHYHPIAGLHPVCVHYHSHFAGHYLCLGIGLLYIHICLWHQVLSFYEYIGGCHCHRLVTTFLLTIYMCTIDNNVKSNMKELLCYHVGNAPPKNISLHCSPYILLFYVYVACQYSFLEHVLCKMYVSYCEEDAS